MGIGRIKNKKRTKCWIKRDKYNKNYSLNYFVRLNEMYNRKSNGQTNADRKQTHILLFLIHPNNLMNCYFVFCFLSVVFFFLHIFSYSLLEDIPSSIFIIHRHYQQRLILDSKRNSLTRLQFHFSTFIPLDQNRSDTHTYYIQCWGCEHNRRTSFNDFSLEWICDGPPDQTNKHKLRSQYSIILVTLTLWNELAAWDHLFVGKVCGVSSTFDLCKRKLNSPSN